MIYVWRLKYFLYCKILVKRGYERKYIYNCIYFRKILNFNFVWFFVEDMLYVLNFCGKFVE